MPTTKRSQKNLIDTLNKMGACPEALRWVKRFGFSTPKSVWDNCKDGARMMWLLDKIGVPIGYREMAIDHIQDIVGEGYGNLHNMVVYCGYSGDEIGFRIYDNAEYSGNRKSLLKRCSDAVRRDIPWSVVRDALDKWCQDNC